MRTALLLPLVAGLAVFTSVGCSSSTDFTLPDGDVSIRLNASGMGSGAFAPNPFTQSLATSATVKWVNADRQSGGYGGSTGTAHRLVSDTGVFDSGTIAPGNAYSFTFAAAGSYAYHCSIHPTMVGTVTITP